MTARDRRRYRRVATGVGLSVASALAVPALALSPAAADTVPYRDPSATAGIGLCGTDGKPVTSGSIYAKPFAWTAVASAAAPADYSGTGQVATLYAFQPRPNIPADQWNGDTLTATTAYTNSNAPMAQATKLDFTLNDFLGEYRPMVDGFLQLRMLFGKKGMGTFTAQYASADIKVTGNTWTLVRGAQVDCSAGKGVSSEIEAIGSSAVGLPTPSATPGGSAGSPTGAATRSSAGWSSGGGAANSSTAGGSPSAGAQDVAPSASPSNTAIAASDSSANNHAAVWIVVVVLVAAGGLGALYWVRLRRGAH